MKNNVYNPSDTSAETDAPEKEKIPHARGSNWMQQQTTNGAKKREMAHSPDQRQQLAARKPVTFERPVPFVGTLRGNEGIREEAGRGGYRR
jgi:hypothetical protein